MRVEFIEEGHIYKVDGVVTPSVSEIIRTVLFPDMYKGVPKRILNNKASFGTNVHNAIENNDPSDLNKVEMLSYIEYERLIKKHNIEIIEQEQIVNYEDLYCGTFDAIAKVDGVLSLIDFKTTYKLDEEYLSWQLSFYNTAHQMDFLKAYAVWLPKKKKGDVVEIELKSDEEVLEVVDKFYEVL